MTGLVLALGAIASVVAYGGVETIFFAPVQAAVAVLAAVQFWSKGWPRVYYPVAFVLAALVVIPVLQLIPLPHAILSALSPARMDLLNHLRRSFGAGFPIPQHLSLSIDAYATRVALCRLTCYCLVFLLAIQVYQVEKKPAFLLGALACLGAFEAVYGMVEYLTGWQYYFGYGRWVASLGAAGTYVNRNHFAGLLEMILPFVAAQILFRRFGSERKGASRLAGVVSSPEISLLLRDAVLFVLLCVALILSSSRMGIAAGIAGIFMVGVIALFHQRRASTVVLLLLITAIPVVYAFWIGFTPVVARFEELATPRSETQVPQNDRALIWHDTVHLIRDYPLLGSGLGTYHWASMHYQTGRFDALYDHAHNDYLESASEIGIPATILLFGALWVLVGMVATRARLFERTRDKIAAAGCAGAMTAILIHGLADFNLQVPANAFIFAWISGTAAALVRKPLTGSSEKISMRGREFPEGRHKAGKTPPTIVIYQK